MYAKASKNHEFLSYLKPYLLIKPRNISEYTYLFEALTSIGSSIVAQDLLRLINEYSLEELSDELITCLFSFESEFIHDWLNITLSNSLPYSLKEKLLLKACEYNRLPTESFLELLKSQDTSIQEKYINTIRIQVRNGINPDKKIIQYLANLMLSNSKNSDVAFDALLEINPQNITHGTIASKYRQKYREFISSKNEYLASSAITILAQSSDIQSYATILELALSENCDQSVKIESIRALGHYHQLNYSKVTNTLHTIYNREKNETHRFFAETALETLGKINIKEISKYIHDPLNQDSLSIISSTENILLFDDYYFDKFGAKHYWIEKKLFLK